MEQAENIERQQADRVDIKSDVQAVFEDVRIQFQAQPYPEYQQRIQLLTTLKIALLENKQALVEALKEDYGYRSEFDSLISDLLPAVNHINYTIKHLKKWMKPDKRHAGILLMPSKVIVEYQPVGVVGVIVPWNFPIVLSIAPIATAIAAGNRVMVKLSEHTPHTNKVLSEILQILAQYVYPIEGELQVSQQFSRLPFDHLIFTGSTPVGKIVAGEAAKNLTPVTLELGGKSPVIIDNSANLNRAANAILLGKSINAGQICVAPDYVLLPKEKEVAFVNAYLKQFKKLYIKKGNLSDMSHIINSAQYERLKALIADAEAQGAKIHTIEDVELEGRQLLPHLITHIDSKMKVMQEEIFGPILPVIGYKTIDDAIKIVNERPRPLALYLMSEDKQLQRQVIEQTHSGGVAINDTLLHVAADDAPFGGIGDSGMGKYHGIEGFKVFSNAKTVLLTPSWMPRAYGILKYRKLAKTALGRMFLR